jgi:hypothetical protein
MKRYLIAVCVLVAGSMPAGAFSTALTKQLKELSGTTRFVQACSLQALIEINKDKNGYRPSHAPVDALAPPRIKGDTMTGNGGAMRSRDKWYQYSFTCVTTSDHLQVKSFNYKIGKSIPKEQWASLNLYE